MRKLLALFASTSTALLLVAGLANVSSAANVTLSFHQEGPNPGSDLWDLEMIVPDEGVQIFAVAFTILGNGAMDFSLSQPATVIDPFSPTGFSVKDTSVAGQMHIVMNVGTPGPIAIGSEALQLGVLHLPTADNAALQSDCNSLTDSCADRFVPGDDDGGTIQDDQFNSLAFDVHFVHVVPEPGTVLLLGIGVAGLSLLRRKAA